MSAPRRPWGARYLVRVDDLCPTMDWTAWNAAEALFDASGVKPLLALIPDNQDPKMRVDPPAADFWERARGWQAKGWGIGLHGHQHRYVNGERGLFGRKGQSEFAGLPYEEQHEKLRQGLEIFAREGLHPDAWVAPSHSFDRTTVRALGDLGVDVISDGFSLAPYRDRAGITWVPQQVGWMRPMPFGIWTFCYHLGDFTTPELLERFRAGLAELGPRMISLDEAVALGDRGRSPLDLLAGGLRRAATSLRASL